MNTVRTSGLAALITGLALVAPAQAETGQMMERCKSQVEGVYGDAADMQLVSKRRYVDGTRMKVAVRQQDPTSGYVSSRFATCWVDAENHQVGWGETDETMIAASDEAAGAKVGSGF